MHLSGHGAREQTFTKQPGSPAPTAYSPVDDSEIPHSLTHQEIAAGGKMLSTIRRRRTTDISCCVVCIGFWVYIGFVTAHAFRRGDPRRLYHPFDYKGHLCGVDPGYEDKPLVYWPRPTQMKYPICLGHCPKTDLETVYVPSESAEILSEDEETESRVWKIIQTQTAVATYESKPMAGKFCVPVDQHGELHKFAQKVVSMEVGSFVGKVKSGAGDLINAWGLLLFMLPFAVAMGYTYLFFLKECAGPLTWGCVFLLLAASCVVTFLSFQIVHENNVERAEAWLGKASDNPMQLVRYISYISLALTVIYSAFICCMCKTIERIVGLIKASCDAIWALPIILPMPLVESFTKLVFFVAWAILFSWVITCGELQYKSAEYGDSEIHGWVRHFTYTTDDKVAIGLYLYALFWGIETITSMVHFVIGYSTSIWYFTPCKNDGQYSKPHIPQTVGSEALWAACRYHLGSLSLGAGIVAVFRLFHAALAFIDRQAKATHNPLAKSIARCCMVCVWCFEEVVQYVNKNAIIEIVLTSQDFFTSAGAAFKLLAQAAPEVAGLNGITVIFQVLGVSSITSVCAYVSYVLMTSGVLPVYSDEESEFYIEQPIIVVVAAGCIGFVVSLAYMLVFDMVSDTLLFCWLTDIQDGEADFAPKPLRDSIGHPRRQKRYTHESH